MEMTTIYLPTALHRELKAVAQRTGRSQAEIIREAVQRYLTEQERPMPKSIGSGANGSLRAEDVEDWLEANWRLT